MEKISMDFAFKKNSIQHGQFLVECHETCPDIEVKEVTLFYPAASLSGNIVVNVDAPDDLAVVLKLRFGQYIKERPPTIKNDHQFGMSEISKKLYTSYKKDNYNRYFDLESYQLGKQNKKEDDFEDSYDYLYRKLKENFLKTKSKSY